MSTQPQQGLNRISLRSYIEDSNYPQAIKDKMLEEFDEHVDFYLIPINLRYTYGLEGIYLGLAFGHNHELFEREYDYKNYDHLTLVDIFNAITNLGWYTKCISKK